MPLIDLFLMFLMWKHLTSYLVLLGLFRWFFLTLEITSKTTKENWDDLKSGKYLLAYVLTLCLIALFIVVINTSLGAYIVLPFVQETLCSL